MHKCPNSVLSNFVLVDYTSRAWHEVRNSVWIIFLALLIFCFAMGFSLSKMTNCFFFLYSVCLWRSLSNVEYAEKIALQKHSMWTSIAADVLLGNVVGVALLCYADLTCSLISNLARDITNHILRSGCVWLMGVPAGFKLNIELAGVLGMISLNAIQIWSTLWFFVGFIFIYVIKALAILGILFGGTLPAALTSDLISVATCHVSTLHWFISLIYSSQIQALAALWRIFR